MSSALSQAGTSDMSHHVGTHNVQKQLDLDLLLNPSESPEPKPSTSSGRDTTVCVELYSPVAPSSLIRMVLEFLQQYNVNNNIKIIVHIYIPFLPEGSC